MAASEDCSTSEGLLQESSSCSEAEETSLDNSPSTFRSLAALQASFRKRCQVDPVSTEDVPSSEQPARPRQEDDGGDIVYSPRLAELTTLSRMKLACEVRKTLRSPSKKFRGLAELVADYNAQKAAKAAGEAALDESRPSNEQVTSSKDNVTMPHEQHVWDRSHEDDCLPQGVSLGQQQQIAKACPTPFATSEDAIASVSRAGFEGSATIGQSEFQSEKLAKTGGD